MSEQPTFLTPRLKLRPLAFPDAPDLQRLAGDREIAATTLTIPHPYEDGVAEEWIASCEEKYAAGERVVFAVTERAGGFIIGTISFAIEAAHQRAELGYWIGRPYWGNGYCTEAGREMVRFGFETVGLARIEAYHFGSNPASGRVMQKIGMIREGILRKRILKWGAFEDDVEYGILREEYERLRKSAS